MRGAIGFSSFAVLVYYAITNAAAFTLAAHQTPRRGRLRLMNAVGLLGCLAPAFTLPLTTVLAGALVLTVGVGGRAVVRAHTRRRSTDR